MIDDKTDDGARLNNNNDWHGQNVDTLGAIKGVKGEARLYDAVIDLLGCR